MGSERPDLGSKRLDLGSEGLILGGGTETGNRSPKGNVVSDTRCPAFSDCELE